MTCVLRSVGSIADMHSEHPLASNFSILLGSIEVTAPNVTTGNDYSIVCEYCCVLLNDELLICSAVFGDSGNYSMSTILNCNLTV